MNFQGKLIKEIYTFFRPLIDADEKGIINFFKAIGWEVDAVDKLKDSILEKSSEFKNLINSLKELLENRIEGIDELLGGLQKTGGIFTFIRNFNIDISVNENIDFNELPLDIFNGLCIIYLNNNHLNKFLLLKSLGIITQGKEEYKYIEVKNGSSTDKILLRRKNVLPSINLSNIFNIKQSFFYIPKKDVKSILATYFSNLNFIVSEGNLDLVQINADKSSNYLSFYKNYLSEDNVENQLWSRIGLKISIPENIDDTNIIDTNYLEIFPFGALNIPFSVGEYFCKIDLSGCEGGIRISKSGVKLIGNTNAKININIGEITIEGQPDFIIGKLGSTRVELEKIWYSFNSKISSNDYDFDFNCQLQNFILNIVPPNNNGFLSRIIPKEGFGGTFDTEIGYSRHQGFHFKGNGGLEFSFPAHLSIGSLDINDLILSIGISNNKLGLTAGANIFALLGPIGVGIHKLGLQSEISFPANAGGNLGLINLGLNVGKPEGIDLLINSSVLTGSGSLVIGADRYFGGLGLYLGDIGLSAFGLITTKMPDGSSGYSLLISICATFNPAIQLGYGFTLNGVGGLIAANRSIDVEKLRGGIKNHTLDGILFPDPNALVDVIGKMEAVFPVKDGQYVVGPMVKIGWGANLLTADIGVFIEFPDPVRILLLGQVKAALPKPDKPIVVINLDVIGVVDFAAAELTFQASLYDSKLLTFEICGDSAILIGWGANPRFALAIGGFHPRFTPPSPASVFAGMKRMSINIGNAGAVQISCGGYMAITSNTLQFGAKAELFIDADSVTVDGYIGFDALFIFSPFAFDVEIYAGVHLKWHGHSLFGLDLHFWLSGPNPWHARGTASIDLWLFSIDVGFDETWGDDTPSTIAPVNPWIGESMLKSALENPDNWGTQLPPRRSMVEILRERKPAPPPENGVQPPPEPVILHPFGTLEIRQRVCPLGMKIQKIANAPVEEYNQFDLVDFKINGDSVVETIEIKNERGEVIGQQIKSGYLVEEHFAPGQYLELTHDDKFTKPSFDRWTAGVKSSPEMQVHLYGDTEFATLQYESAIYSESEGTSDYNADHVAWANVEHLHFAQVARRELHRIDPIHRNSPEVQAKYVNGTKLSKRPMAAVREEQYCLKVMGDTVTPSRGSFYQMEQLKKERQLQDQLENKPAAKHFIIPEYQAL